MSASEITKQAIVRSTKKLASEKPFQKISVIEIARQCDINRNTFYYYFADKYSVIQYIFDREISPVLQPYFGNSGLADSVSALCAHMKKEKPLYTRLLDDSDHHSLRTLLVQYYTGFLMEQARHHFELHKIDAMHQEIIARFYAHGTVGMICDWADHGMKIDSSLVSDIIALSAKENFFV